MGEHRGIKENKGQSTTEYLIVVAAVIAALIIMVGRSNSMFRRGLNTVYNMGIESMINMANRVF